MSRPKLKLMVFALVAFVLVQTADTAVNKVMDADLVGDANFSSLTISFPQPAKYRLEADFKRGVIKVVFPSTNLNPSLEFKIFEDKRVKTITFFKEMGKDAVAEIVLRSRKSSIYHRLSRDGLTFTLGIRSRDKLVAINTDMTKDRTRQEELQRQQEEMARLNKIQEESGREMYKEAMADFQKNDFPIVEKKLRKFIKKYPNSIYIGKAYFVLAESVYRIAKKKRGRIPEAIEDFKVAVVRFPKDENVARGRLRIADLLLDQNLDIEASAAYDNIIGSFPNSKFTRTALLGKAEVFMKRKQYDAAFNELEKILLLFPAAREARAARFKIASALHSKGRYETALKIYEDSNKKWPTFLRSNSIDMNRFADTYFRLGKYDNAMSLYIEITNLFPDSEEGKGAINRIGDIYISRGKKDAALNLLGIQARNRPEEVEGQESRLRIASLGHAKKKLINEKDALIWPFPDYFNPLDTYNDIIKNSPGTKQAREAMFQKSRFLNQEKRYIESIITLKNMMKAFDSTRFSEPVLNLVQDNLFKLIRDYHDQNGYITIINTYVQNFDPFFANLKNPEILMKIGEAYSEMGLYPRAVQKFLRAEELDRQLNFKERLVFDRGKALVPQGKYEPAIEALMPFTDVMDNSVYAPDALHLLGDAYTAQGKDEKAIKVYRRALQMAPRSKRVPLTAYNLGVKYKRVGKYSEAIRFFNDAIDAWQPITSEPEPFYIQESHYQLVETYYQSGQYNDAIEAADRTVRRYPDHNHNNWARYIISDSQVKISEDEKALKGLQELAKDQPSTIYGKVASATVANANWRMKYKELFQN